MRRITRIGGHLQDVAAAGTRPLSSSSASSVGQVLYVSAAGSNRGRPKINQDFFTFSRERSVVCLCDGHGERGEKAAAMVGMGLCDDNTTTVAAAAAAAGETADDDDASRIARIQKKLASEMGASALHSGCSAVWVKLIKEQLVVSNVGDSRCLLVANQNGAAASSARRLLFATRDHKPDDPIEMARIKQRGGQVQRHRNDVPRVCGLALSRVFGDFITKGVVTPDADVTSFPRSQVSMCILATDGVFDVCSSEEVVSLLLDGDESEEQSGGEHEDGEGEHGEQGPEQGGKDERVGGSLGQRMLRVVQLCKKRWKEESYGQYQDDITLAVWKL